MTLEGNWQRHVTTMEITSRIDINDDNRIMLEANCITRFVEAT
jgi:hypothetical protein